MTLQTTIIMRLIGQNLLKWLNMLKSSMVPATLWWVMAVEEAQEVHLREETRR